MFVPVVPPAVPPALPPELEVVRGWQAAPSAMQGVIGQTQMYFAVPVAPVAYSTFPPAATHVFGSRLLEQAGFLHVYDTTFAHEQPVVPPPPAVP